MASRDQTPALLFVKCNVNVQRTNWYIITNLHIDNCKLFIQNNITAKVHSFFVKATATLLYFAIFIYSCKAEIEKRRHNVVLLFSTQLFQITILQNCYARRRLRAILTYKYASTDQHNTVYSSICELLSLNNFLTFNS